MRHAAALLVVILAAACAPSAALDAISFQTPAAVSCALPAGLSARLWVSGNEEPCPLDVDAATGATSGSCVVAPGRVRTVTLDWFIVQEELEILLAQSRGTVDLRQAESLDADFVPQSVVKNACLDVSGNPARGETTIVFDDQEVPPCDLDDSCAQGGSACTNLDEVCAGTDPLDPASEP